MKHCGTNFLQCNYTLNTIKVVNTKTTTRICYIKVHFMICFTVCLVVQSSELLFPLRSFSQTITNLSDYERE